MIFLVLMGDHLYLSRKRCGQNGYADDEDGRTHFFTQTLRARRTEVIAMTFQPIFFRSSIMGSADQLRNSTTSFAIWDVVAGVPSS